MKHVYVGAICVAMAITVRVAAQGTAGTAPAPARQGSSATLDRATMEKDIIANENKVSEAVAKGNLAAFRALVADSGWSVDPAGAMSVQDFIKSFAQFKLEPGWAISDSKIVWSDTNTAVHFYKWTGTGTFQGQPIPPVVWASTVWNKRQGKWVAVFHQETAIAVK